MPTTTNTLDNRAGALRKASGGFLLMLVLAVGVLFERIERQAQLPQHQPGRFVESVRRAVAVGDAGGIELGGHSLDPVDQLHRAVACRKRSIAPR